MYSEYIQPLEANYHTHTPRCGHAKGSERSYIEQAIAGGIRTLGFSDHVPYLFPGDYYSTFRMKIAETEGYVETLMALKEEYKEQIHILIGYEMEYYPAFFKDTLRFLTNYPLDYLILGQHCLENEISGIYSSHATDQETILELYVDQVIEGLQTGVFSYLAHPDMIKFTGAPAVYEKHCLRLCKAAKAMDIPLEINMLGLMEGRNYPSERFFSIASSVQNKIILGCDAHDPKVLSDRSLVGQAYEFAKSCGLKTDQKLILRKPQNYF